MKEAKRVSESAAEQVQLVLSSHINGYKRLFGGQLMAWIDMLGGVIARRHAEHEVTTACIDNLQFKKAVTINSTLVLKGKMTYVGRSSMEVRVDTFVERLDGTRELVNTCYMVLVALDENQKPVPVPQLICETQQEKEEFENGARRQANSPESPEERGILTCKSLMKYSGYFIYFYRIS